jgi:hypothetical protein
VSCFSQACSATKILDYRIQVVEGHATGTSQYSYRGRNARPDIGRCNGNQYPQLIEWEDTGSGSGPARVDVGIDDDGSYHIEGRLQNLLEQSLHATFRSDTAGCPTLTEASSYHNDPVDVEKDGEGVPIFVSGKGDPGARHLSGASTESHTSGGTTDTLTIVWDLTLDSSSRA